MAGNLIQSSSGIIVSTEDVAFPKGNLLDADYSNPFRFTVGTGGDIEIDFLTSVIFDGIFIGNHNLVSSATVTLKAGNSPSPSTVIDTPAWKEKNIISTPSSQSARFLRIEMTDNQPVGFTSEIGELVVEVRVVFPRGIRFGFRPGINQEAIIERTNRGKRYALQLFEQEQRDYRFRFPESERSQFLAFWKAVNGSINPFVWMENNDGDEGLYVSIQQPGFFPKELAEPATDPVFDWGFTLVEESIGAEILL